MINQRLAVSNSHPNVVLLELRVSSEYKKGRSINKMRPQRGWSSILSPSVNIWCECKVSPSAFSGLFRTDSLLSYRALFTRRCTTVPLLQPPPLPEPLLLPSLPPPPLPQPALLAAPGGGAQVDALGGRSIDGNCVCVCRGALKEDTERGVGERGDWGEGVHNILIISLHVF